MAAKAKTTASNHSIYDSFDHYTRFGDPGFDYAVALAKTGGRTVLRFANADYLPVSFPNFSETVGQYVKEVMKLAGDERDAIAEKNRRIADKAFENVDDPTKTFVAPKLEKAAPFLNFAPLQNALAGLEESRKDYDAAMRDPAAAARLQSRDAQIALDNALRQVELTMITRTRLATPPLVQTSDLRTRLLHWLWRENAAGDS